MHDAYYAQNITFWFDVKIFFKTIMTVLKHENIYREEETETWEEKQKTQGQK